MSKLLARAIEIAVLAHKGQFDKGGRPYILHPLWVMNNVRHLGDDYMMVAILHDVVEDSPVTIEDLIKEGFPKRVTDAIDLVTMNGMVYHDRIKVIATNEIARAIKLKDLEHNLKPTRLKGLRKKDHDRIEKYHTAYTYLKD